MKQRCWDNHSTAHTYITVIEGSEVGESGVFNTMRVEICTINTSRTQRAGLIQKV